MKSLPWINRFLVDKTSMSRAEDLFDQNYYLRMYADVASDGINPFEHYCKHGWKEGRNPSERFSTSEYLAKNPEIVQLQLNPLVHFVINSDSEGERRLAYVQKKIWQLLTKALTKKRPSRADIDLVANNLDQAFYSAQVPTLHKSEITPALHYLTIGWLEHKDPEYGFSTRFYLKHNADVRSSGINPYIHYLKQGKKDKWRSTATVKEAEIWDRLGKGILAEAIEEAKSLDPMVAFPFGKRKITSPFSENSNTIDAAVSLRKTFQRQSFDHVVMVPHVRMSGAARVAGYFVNALAQIHGAENIIVLMTDASFMEHKEWFPETVNIFDLSECIEGVKTNTKKIELLLDVLRGLECQHLYNVNSRLFWDALRLFGRQISQEASVTSYMFTWEVMDNGDRVGYPIQWLRDTIDFHDQLFTDTQYLANDLRKRFGFNTHDNNVCAFRTPYSLDERITAFDTKTQKSHNRPRVVWAGRFDRQKRVDILVQIAHANPQIDFFVFGKSVVDHAGIDVFNPPENIQLKGEYENFSEVVELNPDIYLYTSQWDGLPTILLDAAAAGIPIIAPDVGGIGELINSETGWLVSCFDDIDAFSVNMENALADPKEAKHRVAKLKDKIAREHNYNLYVSKIRHALDAAH